MLKKFLISMLGAVAGVWIAIAIAFFSVFAIIGAIVGSDSTEKTSIEKKSALYIDLAGNLPERFQPADLWQLINESDAGGESLVDILDAIRLSANDSKIKGIYITSLSSSMGGGLAAREEIIAALRDFKKSGKWIVAYGDNFTQGDYMLASLADTLILNPMGSVDVHGVASQTMFFKNLLDKLGVNMQILRVGSFKSAVEPFMNTEMSEASKLQTRVMVDSMWSYVATTLADNRGVSVPNVNVWADSMISTWPVKSVIDAKAVTMLEYKRCADDVVRRLCDLDEDDDLRLVSPSQYMASAKKANADKEHIAVYFACGDIVDAGEGGIVGPTVVQDIVDLADDDNVAGLLLRVNSGGGSAFASEQIWEALEYFKSKGKPFYVSMGDYAASGGYYISVGADKIFADRTTLTGSIGVFGMIPDVSNLLSEKIGVNFQTVSSNPSGTILAPFKPLTETQKEAMQQGVNDIYEQFTRRVAAGRDMPQDSVKVIAGGRVWPGGTALQIGLVDEIGSMREALLQLADALDLDSDKVVYYPEVEQDFFAELVRNARSEVPASKGMTLSAETLQALRLAEYIKNMSHVQARMQPILIK